MKIRSWRAALAVVFVFAIAACAQDAPVVRGDVADMVIMNAKVTTLDVDQPNAQAVAIKDGKILAVGGNINVMRHRAISSGST